MHVLEVKPLERLQSSLDMSYVVSAKVTSKLCNKVHQIILRYHIAVCCIV